MLQENKKIILVIIIPIIALSIVGIKNPAYFSAASVSNKKSFVTSTCRS